MSYKKAVYRKTDLRTVESYEGESIEKKVERLVSNKEPIKDGAPEIYTLRSEGIVSAYNIRTDRWEIAAVAMDKVQASIDAARESKMHVVSDSPDVVDGSGGVSGAESVQGETPIEGVK